MRLQKRQGYVFMNQIYFQKYKTRCIDLWIKYQKKGKLLLPADANCSQELKLILEKSYPRMRFWRF